MARVLVVVAVPLALLAVLGMAYSAHASGCGGCPKSFKPVCGMDGKTYSNECTLRCADPLHANTVKLAYYGPCTKCSSQCPKLYMPVCSTKQQTLGNPCLAYCKGAKIASLGACKPKPEPKPSPSPSSPEAGCICYTLYKPVCATDPATKLPKTYGNDCNANCAKAMFLYNGECGNREGDCICTMEYNPVCGNDGKQYSNPCVARCAGITVFETGECKAPEPSPGPIQDCQICTLEYLPQCGMDGKTYGNKCGLHCANINSPGSVKLAYAGECKPSCTTACAGSSQYNPVCVKASNYVTTYGNSCYARCNGALGASADSCPAPKCAARGETCMTGPTNPLGCCAGNVCYSGPVERPNMAGICVDETLPRPRG